MDYSLNDVLLLMFTECKHWFSAFKSNLFVKNNEFVTNVIINQILGLISKHKIGLGAA